MTRLLQSLPDRWFDRVDGSSLAVFRIGFGLLLFVDVCRYWHFIPGYWIEPELLFKYYGFGWVQPLPGVGLYVLFVILGVVALMIAAGLFYRVAIVLFTIGFSYLYLLDQSRYLNHFYLVILVCTLLCFLPAHREWSIDKLRGGLDGRVPRWAVWGPRSLFEIVLLYAGIVKISSDWLQGYPLIYWLGYHDHWPIVGEWLGTAWVAIAGSWFAVLLHLIGAPLLLWRRTRLIVFALYCSFHLANALLWKIGIFPWMTIAGTLMFFEPDWPRRLWARIRRGAAVAAVAVPATPGRAERLTVVVVLVFLFLNIVIPMRPLLYPGPVAWTKEGSRFSWRMKLIDDQGRGYFITRNPATGEQRIVNPASVLGSYGAGKMFTRPDMVLQFAHYLAKLAREAGIEDPEVRAVVWVSINGRPYAPLINPTVDLAKVERNLKPASWILPLDPSLKPGTDPDR